MTIGEAVQLALMAATTGRPGEVFVLDMRQSIRILDLLAHSLKAAGRKLADVPINYSGIRTGERLPEEVFLETESCNIRSDSQILIAVNTDIAKAETVAQVVSFARQIQTGAAQAQVLLSGQAVALPIKANGLFRRGYDADALSTAVALSDESHTDNSQG